MIIRMDRLLQMIIRMDRFMQRINRMDWPLANCHSDGPASCKWSSGWTGLFQIITSRDQPLANDHPDELASCKWLSGGTSLLQMIIRINQILLHFFILQHIPYFPPSKHFFFFFNSCDQGSISWTFPEQCVLVFNLASPENVSRPPLPPNASTGPN